MQVNNSKKWSVKLQMIVAWFSNYQTKSNAQSRNLWIVSSKRSAPETREWEFSDTVPWIHPHKANIFWVVVVHELYTELVPRNQNPACIGISSVQKSVEYLQGTWAEVPGDSIPWAVNRSTKVSNWTVKRCRVCTVHPLEAWYLHKTLRTLFLDPVIKKSSLFPNSLCMPHHKNHCILSRWCRIQN